MKSWQAIKRNEQLDIQDHDNGESGCYGIIVESKLRFIASWNMGWDHVSVSKVDQVPTWDEMCLVKKLFFKKDEMAIQYHPQDSDYINNHDYCLHLWRPQHYRVPLPPKIFI